MCRGAEWERLGGGTSVYVAERHPKNAAGEPQPQDHADNRHQEQVSSTDDDTGRQGDQTKSVVVTLETNVASEDNTV